MKKHILIFTLLISAWMLFTAHEFWLAPSQFRVKPRQVIALDLLVGEDFHGEFWGARKQRTASLNHYFGSKQEDLTAQALASDSSSIRFQCKKAGTHLLAMRSSNSFIELESAKFNAYLEEDGIENIINLRKDKNEIDKSAKEFYQRCAKSLVQAGNKTDDTYVINTGMPLEIIPLQNPYALKVGDELAVKILFQGEPLKDVVVRSWHKVDETNTSQGAARTDGEGVAKIKLNAKGFWMISLVRMIENPNKSEADYQSFWGSLTFEL